MKNIIQVVTGFMLALILLLSSCSEKSETEPIDDYKALAPAHFPPVPFPDDNPYSAAKAELGRYLFYDPLLSKDGSIASCSHCMQQEASFANNKDLPSGFGGQLESRNTMPLHNVAYRENLMWDGRGTRVESNAYRSIFLPYIFGADTNVVNESLKNHSFYPEMFKKAFGENTVPSSYLASLAMATFARTLVSGNSRYDKYINGNKSALNESEIRGMELFFSDRTSCSECHSGIMFTDGDYHNTGTTSHYFDKGRYNVTNNWEDKGKFITPTLRNVEVTYPYLHTGEYWTLEEVINNYNLGGHEWFNKDTLIRPLNLNASERADLVNFLKSLTDREFLNSKKISNPFK
ncbi:MAG: c-type cytochrome [Ignavibacteria bacterium]|jgi:cytochrome c peroxidase|nr:c-type cytochrome [Ignavibacteria bacterium]